MKTMLMIPRLMLNMGRAQSEGQTARQHTDH